MKQQYQGDISVISINETQLPKDLIWQKVKSFVVAEGEITGHKHTIVADPDTLIEIAKDANGYFIRTTGKTTLTHNKHDILAIPQGLSFLGRQVEFDELGERRVQD